MNENKRLINKSIEHFCRPKVYPNFLKNLIKTRSNKKIKRIGYKQAENLGIASF